MNPAFNDVEYNPMYACLWIVRHLYQFVDTLRNEWGGAEFFWPFF